MFMKPEISILHWTTLRGFKKGELVLQSKEIFIYKTSNKFLKMAKDFRQVIYAELPLDVVEEVTLIKKGLMRNHMLCFKLNEEKFKSLVHEKHSFLFRHLVTLFNKKNIIYFPVLRNSVEEIKEFLNLTKERLKK